MVIPQTQPQKANDSAESAPVWPLASRVAVRFGFCYLILYIYPTILGTRSGSSLDANNLVRKMWDVVVPWVGMHVLHLKDSFAVTYNGSGDQLYDYVLWLC